MEERGNNPSAETLKRFVDIIPQFLTIERRYDLLKKLYERHRNKTSEFVTIIIGNERDGIMEIREHLESMVNAPFNQTLPDRVITIATWVCDNDAIQSRKMIATIRSEEHTSELQSH